VFDLSAWLSGLVVLLGAAFLTWLVSVAKRNVAIVDSLWSLMFLMAALVYAYVAPGFEAPVAGDGAASGPPERRILVVVLVAIWALRLAVYITARNWGHPEDYRYQAIRRRNDPGFTFKSLYLVFGLQALLAWVISLPLLGAILGIRPLGPLDYAGVALWLVGLVFEAGGDWQLARFKKDPANKGQVMDRGLWRYTRHPNYFGDFCVWWGFYLIAASAGAWWSFPGPLLMSVLLMKVSGVAMLEKTIGKRRPGYEEYIRRTNAFFPGPRKA
jgi:steroid 5-alpha reductase family enzyme